MGVEEETGVTVEREAEIEVEEKETEVAGEAITYIPDNSILQATVFSFKKPLMKKYSAQVTLLETLNLSIKTLS